MNTILTAAPDGHSAQVSAKAGEFQITLGNSTSTLLQFAYSDVPSGAINTETDTPSWSGSPASYTYDPQSRVTQMTPGSGSALNYGFDASGNPTTLPTGASGSYDNASELTSSTLSGTSTTFTFDADGQRTQASQGGSTIASATYDGAQRLTADSNAAANMSSASYDGDGLRQSTTATPAGGTAATETFTWNTTAAVPDLLMDSENAYIYGPANAPVEQVNLATGTINYLIADSLGSVRGVVNTAGALTASTAYDAWGNPETTSGLTSSTPFGYAGGYTDATGLDYLIHRYYDPQAAGFLSVDPLVDDTTSAYAYASDNPANETDPSGLCAESARATASEGPPPVPVGTPTREQCVAIINYLNSLLGSGHNPARVALWQREYQRYRSALRLCRILYGLVPNRPRRRNFEPIPLPGPSPILISL